MRLAALAEYVYCITISFPPKATPVYCPAISIPAKLFITNNVTCITQTSCGDHSPILIMERNLTCSQIFNNQNLESALKKYLFTILMILLCFIFIKQGYQVGDIYFSLSIIT